METQCYVRIFKTANLLSDTDGYIVGLTNHINSADITVELTKVGSKDRKLLFMTNCLERDPDLSLVPTQELPRIIQALYACTGCDYTSFFSGLGKCSFFRTFCRYSDFICGSRVKGSLSHWKSENSYLAFLRLVGTTYFIKYISTYRGTKSPVALFNSCTGTTIEDQHIKWLNKIRTHVWEEVQK